MKVFVHNLWTLGRRGSKKQRRGHVFVLPHATELPFMYIHIGGLLLASYLSLFSAHPTCHARYLDLQAMRGAGGWVSSLYASGNVLPCLQVPTRNSLSVCTTRHRLAHRSITHTSSPSHSQDARSEALRYGTEKLRELTRRQAQWNSSSR